MQHKSSAKRSLSPWRLTLDNLVVACTARCMGDWEAWETDLERHRYRKSSAQGATGGISPSSASSSARSVPRSRSPDLNSICGRVQQTTEFVFSHVQETDIKVTMWDCQGQHLHVLRQAAGCVSI